MSASKIRSDSIDQYIAMFPQDIQKILEELRKTIREVAPAVQETISYGIPTFKLHGNLVHFAAYKSHIGFYPGGPSAIKAFKDELVSYKQSKGTVQFPLDSPIPFSLVRKMVQFRVKENESKMKKK